MHGTVLRISSVAAGTGRPWCPWRQAPASGCCGRNRELVRRSSGGGGFGEPRARLRRRTASALECSSAAPRQGHRRRASSLVRGPTPPPVTPYTVLILISYYFQTEATAFVPNVTECYIQVTLRCFSGILRSGKVLMVFFGYGDLSML